MKSIQSRLLIMLLIFIVLPYFLSVFFIYTYTKNSVEKYELENSQEQLQKNADELEQYFDDMIDYPYILYRNPDLFRIFNNGFEDSIYFSPMTMEKSLETFYLMRNEFRQIRFYIAKNNESFTIYNAVISTHRYQPNFLKQDPIKQLYTSDSQYLIEPPHPLENYNNAAIVPKSDKTMVMTFHHKITDVLSKKFLGMITIDIDLGEYARICNNLVQGDASSVLLIDSVDRVMYANDRSLIGKPLPADEKQRLNGNRSRHDDDILLSKELSGSLNGWKLIKIMSSQALYEDVRKTAYTNILVGIVVGILGLLMIGIISNRITRPITRLSSKVRSIEGGNMNVPFDDTKNDEIGHLESHMKDMMNRINSHIDREYKLEIENRKNQFRALKSQINPHFLFNALQSIGAVALRSNAPKVYQLLTSLSKMMRYSMQADQWVRVRDEAEYTKAYLSLQTERFGENVSYSVNIDESILDMTIPSMILQPLAENFFKHTYEEGYSKAHLSIYGEKQGNDLCFTVENDGPGLTEKALQALREHIYTPPYEGTYSHEHIGLKNIRDRLLLVYGPSAEMKVDSNDGQGFSVSMRIPIKTYFRKGDEHGESTDCR
ncbi:sensor histidine kinase [Peribacillus simplex]|uniref:cache domain-containing sensor histidine kinase n=1 Tax=Peribacillus simplex TaxID=1478 RepID=UPI001D38BAFD|nr:sensor histidine kinase [Peribacillus simplex]MED3987095.1 sensor histidine kinase [Peribacillus simplex]MED4095792.1 sensor histidine kinase [Peribacillus simplex]CAH0271321.1 Sensor histidine kinase YpdA [Peribacillus simplex]